MDSSAVPKPAVRPETYHLPSARLVGLLADDTRRRVVAALILGAESVDDVVSATGLDDREVARALDRLTKSGLVEFDPESTTYLLLAQAFERAARAEAESPSPTQFPDRSSTERRVLDRAFDNGRLTRIPSKWSHRLIVLDEVAQRFEPGRHYSERQVNAVLSALFDDTATLRRYLVDVGMLDRAGGEYWRSGGRVETG